MINDLDFWGVIIGFALIFLSFLSVKMSGKKEQLLVYQKFYDAETQLINSLIENSQLQDEIAILKESDENEVISLNNELRQKENYLISLSSMNIEDVLSGKCKEEDCIEQAISYARILGKVEQIEKRLNKASE